MGPVLVPVTDSKDLLPLKHEVMMPTKLISRIRSCRVTINVMFRVRIDMIIMNFSCMSYNKYHGVTWGAPYNERMDSFMAVKMGVSAWRKAAADLR